MRLGIIAREERGDLSGMRREILLQFIKVHSHALQDHFDLIIAAEARTREQRIVRDQVLILPSCRQCTAGGINGRFAEHRPILVDDRELLVLGQQLLEGGDHLLTKRTIIVEVLDDGQVGIACTGHLQPGFREDCFFAGS